MGEQSFTDEQVLELAQEIAAEKGLPLVEAMDLAAARLSKPSGVDTTFELTLELKPRVAKFFRESFAGHPSMTVEERLARFLEMQLNRLRGEALARTRTEAEITDGEAATVRRSTFLERNLGA